MRTVHSWFNLFVYPLNDIINVCDGIPFVVHAEPQKGHFFSNITRKEIETKRIRKEIKTIRNPGRDISFPIFIRKEIETRKLEQKSKQKNISFNRLIISFKRYNKSLKRYKIERKLKQEKQNGN